MARTATRPSPAARASLDMAAMPVPLATRLRIVPRPSNSHGTAADAGVALPSPQAAFYLYPDFASWRAHLARRQGVTTGAGLAAHLLERYGMGVLPASVFGEEESALRMRVATGLLYGDTDAQREAALASRDPVRLPWIAGGLARLGEILADLAP